ncbi:unnamed protein product, partial [Prorocentrum cordatum]
PRPLCGPGPSARASAGTPPPSPARAHGMSDGTLRGTKDGLCAFCYSRAADKCSKCKVRWYCSAFCQQKDWKLGHRGDCGLGDIPQATVPAPPPRLLPESVSRPVISDSSWRRLLDASDAGPPKGPARGLRNLGNSCYVNSVLQGLFHGSPLLLGACREHWASCGGGGATACAAGGARASINGSTGCFRCDLEAAALDPRGDEVGPSNVVRWLPRLHEDFTLGMQEDAHEFLRSVLRLIEDEELREHAQGLRRAAATDSGTASSSSAAPEPNADLTASPSRLFGGLLVSQCQCTNRDCCASSFSFESFQDLSLDITEVTDSVEEALRLYTAPERLDKKNGWRCEQCAEVVRARKQITIYSAPNSLVLHLKRFRYETRGKVTKPVAFGAELNLRPFLCAGSPEAAGPLMYDLRVVVVHLDKLGYSHFGHYVAYVRCASEGGGSSWHLLDDSQATEVPEAEVLRQQAYMLIYARAGQRAGAEDAVAALTLQRARSGAEASAADGAASALPRRCRGLRGAVCSFFAGCDGLCTRCYQEEHGREPPAPATALPPPPAAALKVAKAAAPAAAAPKAAGKSAPGKAAPAASASGSGKVKKVGANEQCPCGSGKKYKKCHGGLDGEVAQVVGICSTTAGSHRVPPQDAATETQGQCRAWVDEALGRLEDLALRMRERFSAVTADIHAGREQVVQDVMASVGARMEEELAPIGRRFQKVSEKLADCSEVEARVDARVAEALASLDARLSEAVSSLDARLGKEIKALLRDQQEVASSLRADVRAEMAEVRSELGEVAGRGARAPAREVLHQPCPGNLPVALAERSRRQAVEAPPWQPLARLAKGGRRAPPRAMAAAPAGARAMPSTESSGVLARLQGTVAEKKQQVAAIHAKAEAMRLARLGGGEAPPPAGAVPRAQPPPRGQVPKAPSKAGSTFKAAVDAAGLSAKEKDKDKDRDKEKEKDKGKKDKDKKDKKKKDKDKKDRTHKLEEVPEPPPKGWIKRYTGHFTHQSFGQTSISVSVKLESHDAGVWMIMGQVVDSTVKVIREGERMIFSDGMVTLDGRCRLLGFVRGYTIMEGECGGAFVLAPLEPDGSARRPPRLDQATRRTEEEAKWWYEVTEEVMEEEEDSAHQQQLPEERRRRAKTVAKLWVKADKK